MKTIIEMAREAGFDAESDTLCRYEGWVEPLMKFADLVAAAEREACIVDIQLCIPRSGHSTPEIVFAKKAIDKIRARGNK